MASNRLLLFLLFSISDNPSSCEGRSDPRAEIRVLNREFYQRVFGRITPQLGRTECRMRGVTLGWVEIGR